MKKILLLVTSLFLFNTTTSAADVAAPETVLTVAPSNITWVGKKVTGEHTGTVKLTEGNISLDPSGNLVAGAFAVDMTSIVNLDLKDPEYNKKLTDHLKSEDFFSVDKHKTAHFKITSVKKTGDNTFDVTGNLQIKGITQPVTFTGTMGDIDGVKTFTAKINIDRTLYDIRYGSGKFFQGLGDKLINDIFELHVKLTTVK